MCEEVILIYVTRCNSTEFEYSLWLRCAITVYRILQYFPNFNVQINNFNNYSSNSIICDDFKQKNLVHTLSNY